MNRYELDEEMKQFIDWQVYGWKHGENVYTDFIGSYLLPKKFGIDKRIVFLSARIRSGLLTKEEANNILNCEACFDTYLVGDEYLDLIDSPIVSRDNYDRYNFKEANWLIYYLYLLGTVPYTFYVKYSNKIDEFDYHTIKEVPVQDMDKIKCIIKESKYNDAEIEEVRQKICCSF